jgi:SAM-dependent methyltransferase
MDPGHSALLDAAARPYSGAGPYTSRFARNKLRYDPVFFALLQRGCLPDRGRLIDLGCGRGLLLALLAAAREQFLRGLWPAGWPPPPMNLCLEGVEWNAKHATAAQRALGDRAQVRLLDICAAALPPCSAIALLDVMLYLSEERQVELLERARGALEQGGVLLLREADAGCGLAFRMTRWSERTLEALRGRPRSRLHYRSASQWTALLERLGLLVDVRPMSRGTPFANVLFYCRKRDE